jgi:myo-inositol-1(or 4)-monophosphatase
MRRFREPVETREKRSASDPVSDADLAAQEAMARVIAEHRPADGLLGEEALEAPGDRVWLLDPIDGTLAFLAGLPLWSCVACLREAGDTLVAAVRDPVAADLFVAERGRPAMLNGRPIRVRRPVPLRSAVVRTWCDPHVARAPAYLPALERLAASAAALQAGGSGSQALAWVACGRLDGWVELYPDGAPKEWDWHPGELLVTCAGGCARSVGEWRIGAASDRLADELEAALSG